jgi:steroid delta-isomerase-like uncharacterized protein
MLAEECLVSNPARSMRPTGALESLQLSASIAEVVMSIQDSESVARAFFDALDRRDVDRAVSFLDQNAEWSFVGSICMRGSEALRQAMQAHFATFPDHQEELTDLIATEERVAVEYVGRGTHQAPFDTPYGQIPPTGRRVELPSCDVHQIKNGKIVEIHTYFDWASLFQQLGVIPQGLLSAGARVSKAVNLPF